MDRTAKRRLRAYAILGAAAAVAAGTGSVALGGAWDGSNSNSWNLAANWTPATIPGSANAVTFNDLSIANLSTTLGANFTIPSLTLASTVPGDVSVAGAYTLTLPGGGSALTIDMSAAAHDLTISATGVALGGSQVWNVGTGRTLRVSSVVSGTGTNALAKDGAGTLILSGANTYTRPTTVSGGTLVVGNGGSLASGSAVTVANGSGATLAGNGTVSGSVTVNGTIAPTDATGAVGTIGKLTTGAESWNSGGAYTVNVGNARQNTQTTVAGAKANPVATDGYSDQLIITTGGLTLSNGFTVNVSGTGISNFSPGPNIAGGQSLIYDWVIARVTGGSAFDASTLKLQVSGFSGSYAQSYHFSLLTLADSSALGGTSGNSDVVLRYDYSAVPEATTLLLGIAGLAPILLHRRHRRTAAAPLTLAC